MITSEVPRNWQGLQNSVARILRECGMDVVVEGYPPTVRGRVEVDVVAREDVFGRERLILCECKHWRKKVNQEVVHSFRTNVADTGAHMGYIISTHGFPARCLQRG